MKIKANKLIAVLCAVVMLVTTMVPALTLTAFAEDTVITFTLGANGSASHVDGSGKTSYTETVDGYKLNITNGTNMYTGARDAKGNGALKLGTSSKAGSFKINVPDDVERVIIYVAAYKAKTASVKINGITTTLTKKSDNGQYDVITVDTSTTKTVDFAVSSGYRCMVNTIEFVIPSASACEHANTTTTTTPATCTTAGSTVVTCNDCEDYTKTTPIAALGHDCAEWTLVTAPTCTTAGSEEAVCARCNTLQTATIKATGHDYAAGVCTVCGEEMPLDMTLTFDDTSKRTEFTGNVQVWEDNGIIVTNNKASSTNPVADYSKPARFYKGSAIIVAVAEGKIAKIVFDCNSNDYASALKNSIGSAATVSSDKVTVVFETPVESLNIAQLTAQIRIDGITVTFAPFHTHEYTEEVTDPTCTTPGYTTYTCDCGDTYTGNEVEATGHTYNEEVTDPTCTEAGFTTYTCDCGDTYKGNEVEATGHTFVNSICACGAGSIEASFLQVQVREDGMADVRLVLTLTADELATLNEVGVYASLDKNNKGAGYATTTVYETVNAGGKVVEAKEGTYFVLVEIINISDFDAKIYVTPFVATETTEALGAMVAFSVAQYINN